jgi:hypothetical protein
MLEVSKHFIEARSKDVARDMAKDFNARIILASPVAPVNSQRSRLLWMTTPTSSGYAVSNSAPYMPVLWAGRIFDGEQWRGSLQMPHGGYPILKQTIERFTR